MNIDLLFKGTAIIFAIFSLILIYRVIKGPTIIDRVLSADAIDILAGIIMVLFGALENRAMYLDLGLIITLLVQYSYLNI